jgi:hypothetical protein
MIDNETAISHAGIIYHARVGEGRFEVVTGINFKVGMLEESMTEDGKVTAQMRREKLHQKLDAWLDSELAEDDL